MTNRALYTLPRFTWANQEGDFIIPMEVIGEKSIFGRIELLITPVGGSGSKWVYQDKVRREE